MTDAAHDRETLPLLPTPDRPGGHGRAVLSVLEYAGGRGAGPPARRDPRKPQVYSGPPEETMEELEALIESRRPTMPPGDEPREKPDPYRSGIRVIPDWRRYK